MGGLSLSIEAWRVIEDASATPEILQTNMAVADECGNKGIYIFFLRFNLLSKLCVGCSERG